MSPAEAADRLRRATTTEHHAFWPCSVSVLDPHQVDFQILHGHRQVTDVYLLALAAEHGGRLVTFDRHVPLAAAPRAKLRHMAVIDA